LSSGAIQVPLPNIFCWYLGKCQFYHSSAYYIIPPGLDVTILWYPEETDKVQLIFAVTFGKPRNYATGETIETDEIGFWHRGKGMKLHWDPLVESVPGYSPVLVKFGNDVSNGAYVDVLPIEELFEKVKGQIVFDGKHEMKEVEEPVYIFSYGKYEDGVKKWLRIRKIFRHKYNGEVVRVVASGGLVDTSPNHSLIKRNGQVMDAASVKPGDHISVPNISEAVFEGGHNCDFIGELDLAKFYGLFVAEGTTSSTQAKIANKNLELLEWAKETYIRNFHRPASIQKCKDGTYALLMSQKNVARFFRDNFYTKFGEKRVPGFILNAGTEVKKAFLEGFLIGDGLKNPRTELEQSFVTDSQTLAQGIIFLWKSVYGTGFTVYNRDDYPRTIEVKFRSDRTRKGIKYVCEKCGYEQWCFPDSREIKCKKCRSRQMRRTEEEKELPWTAPKPRGIVKKVTRLSYEGWMYDIESEDPHTFTTGIGPVKVHNSVFGVVYPHITPATKEEPFEIRFVNRTTNITAIMDVSIWIFEYHKKDYQDFLEFARGFVNLFRLFGRFKTAEEAEAFLRGLTK